MGAHTAPSSVRSTSTSTSTALLQPSMALSYIVYTRFSLTLLMIILLNVLAASSVVSQSESDTLLKFKDFLVSNHNHALENWNNSQSSPCTGDNGNWVGVLCSKGYVYGLQIENMGLKGRIDTDTLTELRNLRTLSFMNNSFDGVIPELKKLGALKSVYLSYNHFDGEIMDDAFEGMLSLKKVYLAHNGFTGKIPKSLTKLPKLLELRLEVNQFEGEIPNFQYAQQLKIFNVSNNQLAGSIPASLVNIDSSSFTGNKDLCGEQLGKECKKSSSDSKRSPVIVGTAVAVVVVAIATIIVCLFLLRRHNHRTSNGTMQSSELDQMEKGSPRQSGGSSSKKAPEQGKLTFLSDDRERFDLHDLLKASAEILGGGVIGSSYKASLMNNVKMVVKRFRYMNNVGKEEFQQHMTRLGRLRHPNLLPLVAYYYRKEEKLLVYDYVNNGSLALYLHGKNNKNKLSNLDWSTRLRIVKGVAKGISYLYKELPSLTAPHGHLKSSNILLDESFEPLLTDYGLVPITNQEHSQDIMAAYKSPEYIQNGRITKKTDVWCFGILILEILTGRYQANFLQRGNVKGGDKEEEDDDDDDESDLARWVQSVGVDDEWKEVFDKEIGETKNSEAEMIKLLKIGLCCCESDVDKRIELKEAIERIEELRDFDEEFYSSYTSEGDAGSSSRNVSDDFNYVSVKL